MTYNDALTYIHTINWRGSKRGLSRTRALLEKLGSPEKKLKFVHIAGTNGKGSVSAYLDSILRTAGYKTGLYTSPFIERFNERICVDGKAIEDEELAEMIERIQPVAEAEPDKPTEFELITALGLLYFVERKCDIVVLEVGMGGRLDSTNVIPAPELAVITSLGLDHTRYLGSTITDIAREKAGIIKHGSDVVLYDAEPDVENVIASVCKTNSARLHRTGFSNLQILRGGLDGTEFIYDGETYKTPLAGVYQPKNAATAIKSAKLLTEKGYHLSEDVIKTGLSATRWHGRFELLRRNPVVILDGAHNPQGVSAAVSSLKEYFPNRKIVFLMGVMADKDIDSMLPMIAPLAERVFTVTPNNPRAMAGAELRDRFIELGTASESCDRIEVGVERAIKYAGRDGIVCALGSLYMSQDVREAVYSVK